MLDRRKNKNLNIIYNFAHANQGGKRSAGAFPPNFMLKIHIRAWTEKRKAGVIESQEEEV